MARRADKNSAPVRLVAPPSLPSATSRRDPTKGAVVDDTEDDEDDSRRDAEAEDDADDEDEPEDDLLIRKAAERREEERRTRAEQAEENDLAEKIVESESRDVEHEAAWEKSLSQDVDDDDDDDAADGTRGGGAGPRRKTGGGGRRKSSAHANGADHGADDAAEKEAAAAKKQRAAEEKRRRSDEKKRQVAAERAEKKRMRDEKKACDKAERERNRRYVSDYRAERASVGGHKFRTHKSKPLDASCVDANSSGSGASRGTSGWVGGGAAAAVVVDIIAEADGLMRLVDDGDASLSASSGSRAGGNGSGSSNSSTGSDYSVAVELRRRYRRFEEFFLAFHVSLEDALAVLAQVKNAALVATEEVAPGHRLRDSPWGRDLMDEVTRRREIYQASDHAVARASVAASKSAADGGTGGRGGRDEDVVVAISDDHVAAMWKCVIVPMARYYVHRKREQVELRADNMRRLLEGDLWQWISASSEDHQRAFRSQYTLRFGPPKTKSKKPGRAAHSSLASRKRKGPGTGSVADGGKKARTNGGGGGGDGDTEDGDSERDAESERQTKTAGRTQIQKTVDGGDDDDGAGGGGEKKQSGRSDHAAYDFSHLGDADMEVLWRLMAMITLRFAPPSWTRSFVVPRNLW